MSRRKDHSQEDLQSIPGVGPSIARDLRGIGIQRVADLRGRDPERLYALSNRARGVVQDRCLLYVFRCAVYFASMERPKPALLNWWAWKDAKPGADRGAGLRPHARAPSGRHERRRAAASSALQRTTRFRKTLWPTSTT